MTKHEVIPIQYPESDVKEETALIALYGASDGSYNSYSLAWKLHPYVRVGTEDASKVFADTRVVTEGLIAQSLVRGVRMTGADGVYFESLKLTPKGERKAIECKNHPKNVVVSIVGDSEDIP